MKEREREGTSPAVTQTRCRSECRPTLRILLRLCLTVVMLPHFCVSVCVGEGYLTTLSVSIPIIVTTWSAGRMELGVNFCVDLEMKSAVHFSKILILYPDNVSSFSCLISVNDLWSSLKGG
jgi:hypothetical protein